MLITSSTRLLQAATHAGHAGHSRCLAVRRLLIPLVPVLAIGLNGCATWDYTMIRDEFQKCSKVADNRIAGGQVLAGFGKSLDCGEVYKQKLIDRFGTDDPTKINVTPLW